MKIRLLRTEGFGGTAEVEVAGERLVVLDRVSSAQASARPGPLEACFDAVAVTPRSWWRALSENPDDAVRLEHLRGWRYRGYGRVESLDPARLDVGPFVLALEHVPEEARVGDHVRIEIDRIALRRGC